MDGANGRCSFEVPEWDTAVAWSLSSLSSQPCPDYREMLLFFCFRFFTQLLPIFASLSFHVICPCRVLLEAHREHICSSTLSSLPGDFFCFAEKSSAIQNWSG